LPSAACARPPTGAAAPDARASAASRRAAAAVGPGRTPPPWEWLRPAAPAPGTWEVWSSSTGSPSFRVLARSRSSHHPTKRRAWTRRARTLSVGKVWPQRPAPPGTAPCARAIHVQHRGPPRASARPVAAAHQEAVDGVRGLAALADRPYHQALPAAHVAGGEHLAPRLDAVVAVVGVEPLEAAARHDGQLEVLDESILDRPGEAHGEQHEVGRQLALAARYRLQALVNARVEQPLDAAVAAGKTGRRDGVLDLGALGLAGGDAQLQRPVRPGQRLVLLLGRHGHDLELRHRPGALPERGADAVAAR